MSDVFQHYSGDEEDNNSDDDEVDDGESWETEGVGLPLHNGSHLSPCLLFLDTDEDDDSSDDDDDDEEIETEEGVGPAIFAKKTTSFGGAVTLEEDETDHVSCEFHRNVFQLQLHAYYISLPGRYPPVWGGHAGVSCPAVQLPRWAGTVQDLLRGGIGSHFWRQRRTTLRTSSFFSTSSFTGSTTHTGVLNRDRVDERM